MVQKCFFWFVLLCIITLPLPLVGFSYNPLYKLFNQLNAVYTYFPFFLKTTLNNEVDSTGYLLHLVHLCIISIFCGLLIPVQNLKSKLYLLLRFYLCLVLFIYGANKIALNQFYTPLLNIKHTNFGLLDKDIAWWSSMGLSKSYQFILGFVELCAAFLLLFKRTFLIGTMLSICILSQVFLVNICFNISLKMFSGLLLIFCIILISPYIKEIILFLIQLSKKYETKPSKNTNRIVYGLILFMALWIIVPYFFQKKQLPEKMFVVTENKYGIKRVFFHPKGYLIIQKNNCDTLYDFPVQSFMKNEYFLEKNKFNYKYIKIDSANNILVDLFK